MLARRHSVIEIEHPTAHCNRILYSSSIRSSRAAAGLLTETPLGSSSLLGAISIPARGPEKKSKGTLHQVNKYAFSGGQDSIENHRKYGANLDSLQVDIPVKYLSFFLEDDAELDHIKKEYGAGRLLTGEVKMRLIEVLSELVERHRKARALVTDEVVDAFMAVRPLPYMFS